MKRTPFAMLVALMVLAVAVAVPVLAASPSSPPGQSKEKAPKAPITVTGTVEQSTDADGQVTYTLTAGGVTYVLEAGPKWFFGDAYPLKQYVGKSVKIDGEIAKDSTELDVLAVDGVAIREPGKPPWAGGWKRVGQIHPGWSQEKADRFKAKFGDCFPPGQCKDKPARGGSGTDKPGESPDSD